MGECDLGKSHHLHGPGQFTCSWGWSHLPAELRKGPTGSLVDEEFPAPSEHLVPAGLALPFPASLSTPSFPGVLPSWGSDFGGSVGHVHGAGHFRLPPPRHSQWLGGHSCW